MTSGDYILGRPPVKKRRTGPARKGRALDSCYLEWIRTQRCVIENCVSVAYPSEYSSRIEAHHAGDHGFAQKADDRTAIPLCMYHHTAGPYSAHRLGKVFWTFHGLDRDELVKELNRKFEEQNVDC